jgi:methionyl-tRNA formyltransferase
MRIVFFGTPDFAVTVLKKIYNSENQILAVVTVPDKPRGRGKKLAPSPVKVFALEKKLPVLQPENLKDGKFLTTLRSLEADVFVVVAFKILPEAIYSIPPKGSFNLHASLLPKYRGAAPIHWALINGEKETGVTTFFLEKKVDTGNIILQKKISIDEDDNLGSLYEKLSILGAEATLETLDLIEKKNFKLLPQDDALATPAPKITKEICRIDWNKTANEIKNLIRGLSPAPGAFFQSGGKNYKIFNAKVIEKNNLNVGEVKQTKKEIFIGCRNSALQILEIQPEGRKRMTAEEFLRGYSLI